MLTFKWCAVIFCLLQSALFSGLTLGLFGLSRLRLEVQAETKNKNADKILDLRKDANFLLATLLWGNVAINVLIALLSDSLLSGVGAFLFSTCGITFVGEILPQAYFSRHALRVGVLFIPVVKFYQFILYPFAKPTALFLDHWLGKEGAHYFKEEEFMVMLQKHADSATSDLGSLESLGAANFLTLDDVKVEDEGEVIDEASIFSLPLEEGICVFPKYKEKAYDVFLQKIHLSQRKWVILTDPDNKPNLVLDADGFLRDVMYNKGRTNPLEYCHKPILIEEQGRTIGHVLRHFKVRAEHVEDDVIDHDIIICWGKEKRIITGSDILGRLLRGIAMRVPIV